MALPVINKHFVLGPSLQEFFIDKGTNLPLTNGLVFFYHDNARSVLKPVYEIVLDPLHPNTYNFVELPNPIVLSGAGTIQDPSGFDILPYYFPFEGTPTDPSDVVDLYYIVVTDQFGIPQFTRQAFPGNSFVTPEPTPLTSVGNFVPNGQFLIHNDHVPVPYPNAISPNNFTYPTAVPYTVNVVPVAPGGWTFERSSTSTATNTITFHEYLSSPGVEPSNNPRYAIDISRSNAVNDQICDLRIRWNDVFKFAGQEFTLLFTAQALSGGTLTGVNVRLIQYFGVNGSTATDTPFDGPFTFTTTPQQFAAVGTFPAATGSVGSGNNDDFLQLAIRFPSGISSNFSVRLTDFILAVGAVDPGTDYPNTTNGDFLIQAMENIAPVPPFGAPLSSTTDNYYQPDGSTLYLPLVMTTEGFTWDTSQIGTIVGKMTTTAVNNELLCDGSAFDVNEYSTIGIPYRRLFNSLYDSTNNIARFGGGADYVNAFVSSGDNTKIILKTNKVGLQTATANGANSPGFTYLVNFAGTNSTINYKGYSNNATTPQVTLVSDFTAATHLANGPSNNSTGAFTITPWSRSGITIKQSFSVAMQTAAAIANPGLHAKGFTFSDTANDYELAYKIATETTVGVTTLVFLDAAFTARDVGIVTAGAIDSATVTTITCVAAAAIPANAFFTFNANGLSFVVWYDKGGGTQPVVVASRFIKVNITNADTAANVASKTQIAINNQFFAVPNLQGFFLRGTDSSATYDQNEPFRFGFDESIDPGTPGSFEVDANLTHFHGIPTANGAGGTTTQQGTSAGATATTFTDIDSKYGTISVGSDAHPFNVSVNWFIKY